MHKHFYGIPKSISFIKIHIFYVQLFTYPVVYYLTMLNVSHVYSLLFSCRWSSVLFPKYYFWDRERQSMNGGGAEREGDTESETGSRL